MSVSTKTSPAGTSASIDAEVAEDESNLSDEERRLRQIERNQSLIALLDAWMAEDLAAGIDETDLLEEFKRGIDANRIPGSGLFDLDCRGR